MARPLARLRPVAMFALFLLLFGVVPLVVGLYAWRSLSRDDGSTSDDPPPPEPPRPLPTRPTRPRRRVERPALRRAPARLRAPLPRLHA